MQLVDWFKKSQNSMCDIFNPIWHDNFDINFNNNFGTLV
jgi:hypothetical protein